MKHHRYGNGGEHWGLWILMIVTTLVLRGEFGLNIVTPVGHHLDERVGRGEFDEKEYTRRRTLLEGSG